MTGTEARKQFLGMVEACVCKNRQDEYGGAENNFKDIAAILNIRLQRKLSSPLDELDVAAMMIAVKLARQIQSPENLDNWVDTGGYAACAGGIVINRQEQKQAKVVN